MGCRLAVQQQFSSPGPGPLPVPTRTDHQRVLFSALTVASAVLALYLALIVYSRIDRILVPSRQLRLGLPSVSVGPLSFNPLPLVDTSSNYSPKDRINVLVLGLDRRPNEGKACTRADSFLIVSFDSFSKTASILSIPRDLYVDIPDGQSGTYQQRINTTTVFGCGDRYSGGGPGLARDTVRLNFGIDVRNYVMIDFIGFERLIDALGGIDVDVPEPIAVGSKVFAAGPQHMTGEQALTYARLRPDNDFKRIERQQLVMIAAAKKALGLGVLNDPLGTYVRYQDAIETDVQNAQLPGLALLAKDVGLDNVDTYSLACYRPDPEGECIPATQSFTAPDGAAVQLPLWELSFAIINQAMPDPGIRDDAARVALIGGTPEELERARAYLVQKGIRPDDIVDSGLAIPNDADQGIYDVGDKTYTAHRIAEWLDLDGDIQRVEDGSLGGADVIIVLGEGYRLPGDAVVHQ